MNKNKTNNYDLTIIVPVYNEEDNILHLSQALNDYISSSLVRTCILFIDDKSSDASFDLIKKVCDGKKEFFYIGLDKRGGLSTALKTGIDMVESKYLGYIDADLQTSPEDFNLLLDYIKDYELVTGIRTKRKDSIIKLIQSKIANKFRRIMIGDKISDTGCPLKLIHSNVAKKIPFFNGMHRFIPALVLLQNCKIKEIPVRHFPRMAGKSKYHLWNRLLGPFIDCFIYRWMRKRYISYSIDSTNIK